MDELYSERNWNCTCFEPMTLVQSVTKSFYSSKVVEPNACSTNPFFLSLSKIRISTGHIDWNRPFLPAEHYLNDDYTGKPFWARMGFRNTPSSKKISTHFNLRISGRLTSCQ